MIAGAYRFSVRLIPVAAVVLVGSMVVPAAHHAKGAAEAPAADADGFVSLFDGKTLNGWVVTDCKAAVEDGNLVVLEGKGFVRAEKTYGDFVLELDWKARQKEKYDSGIYFRSDPPRAGRPWPDKYQINLLEGQEGSIVGNKDAKVAGLAKPAGEWNHFKLTVVGKHAELEVNGKPAWKVDNIEPAEGQLGIQVEVPNGGQFEFRNIRIKVLGK